MHDSVGDTLLHSVEVGVKSEENIHQFVCLIGVAELLPTLPGWAHANCDFYFQILTGTTLNLSYTQIE